MYKLVYKMLPIGNVLVRGGALAAWWWLTETSQRHHRVEPVASVEPASDGATASSQRRSKPNGKRSRPQASRRRSHNDVPLT